MDVYDKQDRGGASAYDRYLRGMDASMRQKVALTAAHLLCIGDVADMGMGSGSGSHALAALYPKLRVTGVDISEEMVKRARERYQLGNLRFTCSDIAAPCFPPSSMEAILNSSVLHHVTSFGGYDHGAAERALATQVAQLAPRGVVVVRDFLGPGSHPVWLDVPTNDGDDGDDPTTCSTATLLERFSREFRSLAPDPGFPLAVVEVAESPAVAAGFRRYQLSHVHAVEFVLRKDYRQSWSVEVQEEYTYGTQEDLEAMFARLGLRVLASTPIFNPWIVRNRFEGQFRLWNTDGVALDFPATNYVIVGQRVPADEGVRIIEERTAPPMSYLALSHHQHIDTQQIYDLARRPGTALDIVPWFEQHGATYVLARRSYPRPLTSAKRDDSRPLNGATPSTYVTEPLLALRTDKPVGETIEERLAGFTDMASHRLRGVERGNRYFPSPGGLLEQVEGVLVEVDATHVQREIRHASGFSTAGVIRAIEARQLLRAAQVGGLPDARMELNVYELLHRQGKDVGAWIGEAIALPDGPTPPIRSMASLRSRPHRRMFRPTRETAGFLDVRSALFAELNADGKVIHRQTRELVEPRRLSRNTIAVAALRRSGDRVFIGVDDDDLPAAQCFDGNSELLVAPAWRLPPDVDTRSGSQAWIAARMAESYGVEIEDIWELGGSYFPAAGLTPEVVYPLAVACSGDDQLVWIDLRDALLERDLIVDGHLVAVLWRAAHACGVLS